MKIVFIILQKSILNIIPNKTIFRQTVKIGFPKNKKCLPSTKYGSCILW